MKKFVFPALTFLIIIFSSVRGVARDAPMEIHCKHFFHGYPLGTPPTNDLIIRDIYALSSNDTTKFADWVAYRLTVIEVMGDNDQTRKWRTDPWLDENETLDAKPKSKDAYKGAKEAVKVDRGHQAPLASFRGTLCWYQTNYYSNITPQKSELNQGPWKKLEIAVRTIVKTNKVVYVMTGPLYENPREEKLPNVTKAYTFPSGYWKIVFVLEDENKPDKFQAAAFIFPQDTPRKAKVLDHLTTIRAIEKKTKLNFLWELDDAVENKIETTNNSAWIKDYIKE